MKDQRLEIIKAYQEANRQPINQAVLKMMLKFDPQWEQASEMIVTAQAVTEALETEGGWLTPQEKEIIRETMQMGMTEGFYSRQDNKLQKQVIEATLNEEEPRIQVDEILQMKSLEEMNDYLITT